MLAIDATKDNPIIAFYTTVAAFESDAARNGDARAIEQAREHSGALFLCYLMHPSGRGMYPLYPKPASVN